MPQVALALWLLASTASERVAPRIRTWTPMGPTEGVTPIAIQSVAFDPVARMLYAGTAYDPSAPFATRVFRRASRDDHWTGTASPELGGLYPYVALTTDSAGAVYAYDASCLLHPNDGCGGTLARSADQGQRWNRLRDDAISSVRIDPVDPELLVASVSSEEQDPMFPGYPGIVETTSSSRDGGATWTDSTSPPLPLAFAFDPTRVGVMYAATAEQGVWTSVDSGLTWSSIGAVDEGPGFSIAVDRDSALFIATNLGVLVSPDGGAHWSLSRLTAFAGALLADLVSGGAWAGTQAGVFHVDANGFAVPVGSGVSGVIGLATDGQRIWAAAAGGVFEYEVRRRMTRTEPNRP